MASECKPGQHFYLVSALILIQTIEHLLSQQCVLPKHVPGEHIAD
jgi:hypothetical protein